MIDANAVQEWSQRLRDAPQRGETRQAQALLSAFARIEDAVLKEQMVLLLEMIASNPRLLERMKTTAFTSEPDRLDTNVIHLRPPG
jgi:hypothetical protein